MFLEADHRPKLMVLMVQKEVAQRVCAKPPDMSLLAVAVQFYGKPSTVSYVKKDCFWPQPKVDSAILKITPIAADINTDARRFFKVVKAGFKQPRKQLLNNFVKGLGLKREAVGKWLKSNAVLPDQRAESLALQDWINLANALQ
jgi:16S rRNA (adenine1518-N6/adenine1519-N6)-dimethyltransferase